MSLEQLQALKGKAASRFTSLQKQLESSNKSYGDDRLWFPAKDEKNNTRSAVIRFLPSSPKDGDFPSFVDYFEHSFKVGNNWYIEKCPTTKDLAGNQFGQCPICEANSEVFAQLGKEEGKKQFGSRLRNHKYVSNILIIKDPMNPENEGTVRLFEFKNTILGLIKAKIKPEFSGEEPIDVFSFWEGCDFNFKVYNKAGNASYERSTWSSPSSLGTDEYINDVWNQCHSLKDYFTEQIKVKPYADLVKRWNKVNGKVAPATTSFNEENIPFDDDVPPSLDRHPSTTLEDDDLQIYANLLND
jgi:hypothetical protein